MPSILAGFTEFEKTTYFSALRASKCGVASRLIKFAFKKTRRFGADARSRTADLLITNPIHPTYHSSIQQQYQQLNRVQLLVCVASFGGYLPASAP